MDRAPSEREFRAMAEELEPRLRAALSARFGPVRGREATCDTLAWAWEHWARVSRTENPGGYLYRVGARRAGAWRWSRPVPDDVGRRGHEPWVEPGLPRALGHLTPTQRQVVVLVEGYGMTQSDVADLLGVRRPTVQTHLRRGLQRLRTELGVTADA